MIEAYALGHKNGYDDEAAAHQCDDVHCQCNGVCTPFCSYCNHNCGCDSDL